jgi:hypothetical protein
VIANPKTSCICGLQNRTFLARTRSSETSYGRCSGCSGSGNPNHPSCSLRSGVLVHHRWLRPDDRACGDRGQARIQGPLAYAAARLRLRPSQYGSRYAGAAGVSWAQKHSAHGPAHRTVADAVQGFLAVMGFAYRDHCHRRNYYPGCWSHDKEYQTSVVRLALAVPGHNRYSPGFD